MSIEVQEFSFTKENLKKAKEIITKYPAGKERSAVLPLLDIAQRQSDNWLPSSVIEYVAKFLDLPFIRVYEVASFYSMFNLKPVGKHHIQVCGTTPCWLRGGDKIMDVCKNKLGINPGETSKDKMFTLTEVECLGACVDAPVVQVNDNYFENLNEKGMAELIKKLQQEGLPVKSKGGK